jgi:hypothetical protein
MPAARPASGPSITAAELPAVLALSEIMRGSQVPSLEPFL